MLELHPNTEAWNALCATVHARGKDSPAKTWWHAEAGHAAIYRALRIDPAEFGAFYAGLPFRLARIDGKPLVLAAHPCPLTLGPIDEDWLGIEAVTAWNPVDGSVSILGDDGAQIIGDLTDAAPDLYANAFAFFRAWVETRAAFAMTRTQFAGKDWAVTPTEYGEAPGALIVGDPDKVRWPTATMPRHLVCHGIDAIRINKAILRSANLPRAVTGSHNIKKAA